MNKFSLLAFALSLCTVLTTSCGFSSSKKKEQPIEVNLSEKEEQKELENSKNEVELLPEISKEESTPKATTVEPTSPKKIEEQPEVSVPPKKIRKKKAPKKFAKMTFDSIVHRLPDVIEGDHFKHKFVFENTGEVPLSISEARASCGCTTPSVPFLDIAPGEKSAIGVDYFSVNKDGPQEAEIVLKANTWPSSTTLTMVFNVLPKEEEAKKDTLSN